MTELPRQWRRRGLRRPFVARCDAISIDHRHRVGQRLLDLSPRGALVAMDREVEVGERVLLSIRMPWLGPMLHVRCVVERVIHGRRREDPTYCAGLRFSSLRAGDRLELARRLEPLPRQRGARPHPADYARAVRTVRATGVSAPSR